MCKNEGLGEKNGGRKNVVHTKNFVIEENTFDQIGNIGLERKK